MKRFYKVYAQCVTELHPIQRLNKKKLNDALGEAVDYQTTEFLERSQGILDGLPEAKAIKDEIERIRAAQESEEITDWEAYEAEKEEALQALVYDLWDKGESIGCGAWGLVQVEGDEKPSRPCKWC